MPKLTLTQWLIVVVATAVTSAIIITAFDGPAWLYDYVAYADRQILQENAKAHAEGLAAPRVP